MKRFLFLLISLYAFNLGAQTFYDASGMDVFGKAVNATATHYSRFPQAVLDVARKDLRYLATDAAGLYVEFRTDSPSVHVRWKSVKKLTMSHMSSVGSRGVDLYAHMDDGWRFVGSARPALDHHTTTRCIIKDIDPGYHEFRMYLSLYDGIESLEIGVEEGSDFVPVKQGERKAPVVMYGTSILQGGCVSRPGMAYTNILGRWLGREVVNLGFSGNAKLDPEVAQLMAVVENPAVFVLDNVPNDTPELILEKAEPFVGILRAAHPDVPIVFVEQAPYAYDSVSSKSAEGVRRKNAAQRQVYERLCAAGDANLYYVEGRELIGTDGEATVDYVHQTDLGQMRYAQVLFPLLEKLCK